jgi:hypothetical protein
MLGEIERKVANRILQVHDQGGYRFSQFVGWQAKAYVLGVVYMVTALAFFAWVGLWGFFWLTLGLFAGMWLRDYGHLLAANRSWPLLDRVINWELVKQIARGEGDV